MTDSSPPAWQWPIHPAAELFPLIADAELAELAEDIQAHGLLEPIWLYDDPELGRCLLDGRNRYRGCEKAGVALETRLYRGDDPVTFSISQNMQRRHLTVGQKADVALRSLPLYEAEAKRKERQRKLACATTEATGADLPQSDDEASLSVTKRAPRSRDRAAKTAGTSGRAVAQMKRVTEQAPDLAEKVRAGVMSLDRAERVIRDREAEKRRIEQARLEAEAQDVRTHVDIFHGDFREVFTGLKDVDAIITDPPYSAEYIPLLGDLAAWADKVLSPDGVLAVLIGQSYLPEVYRLLDGHRTYRWTGCYLTEGAGYVSHPRRVQSNWKPLIVYGEGGRLVDVVRATDTDATAKENHRWGQDYQAFHTIVERLTKRGQTIVDPFMGGGTTLLAAHALGRHAIGCDIDPDAVAKTKERLSG